MTLPLRRRGVIVVVNKITTIIAKHVILQPFVVIKILMSVAILVGNLFIDAIKMTTVVAILVVLFRRDFGGIQE